mgnify:CR=1 FL=1
MLTDVLVSRLQNDTKLAVQKIIYGVKFCTIDSEKTASMKFPKDWSWKLDNNCNTQRSFICKLDKYGNFSVPEDDLTIKEHLGDPLECENGWQTHEGSWHCFKAVGTKVSYPEAKRQCQANNAYLVSLYGDSSNHYAQRSVSRKKRQNKQRKNEKT